MNAFGDRLKQLLSKSLAAYCAYFMVYVSMHMMREKLARFGKLVDGTVLDFGAGTKPYRDCFVVERYVGVNALRYYLPNVPPDVMKSTDVWVDGHLPIPFKSEACDGVVCFQVLSVIENPQGFFSELARVLKAGGHLLLSTDFLYPKWAKDDYLRHTDTSLRTLASDNGFEVIAVESFGGCLTTLHSLAMRRARDAQERFWSASSFLPRVVRSITYLGWLVSLPAWALGGWAVLLIDQNRREDYTFTTNLLLVARRQTASSSA